jgi:hypothetical protein
MPCEHYKDALIEATATGADPQGELRAHLAACDDCRATLEQEQFLFTAIDSGLRTTANAEVPPSLLPRVRAALDEVTTSGRGWTANWLALGAVAALVVVIFGAYSIRRRSSLENPVSTAVNTSTTKAVPPSPPSQIPNSEPSASGSSVPHLRTAFNKNPAPQETLANRSPLPEVLIPRDQEVLLAHYAQEWSRRKRAPFLAESADDAPLAPLQVAPIQIAQLDVKLMAEEKSQ